MIIKFSVIVVLFIKQTDPRLDIYGNNSAPMLKVLREQKRWEDIPKRREPVTSDMIDHMWERCKTFLLIVQSIFYMTGMS